eukprot:15453108-Alexandrium_andersonii.AAC.1
MARSRPDEVREGRGVGPNKDTGPRARLGVAPADVQPRSMRHESAWAGAARHSPGTRAKVSLLAANPGREDRGPHC